MQDEISSNNQGCAFGKPTQNIFELTQTSSSPGLKSIADYFNYTQIESFSGVKQIDEQNEKDLKELQRMDDEFNRALSKYSTSQHTIMDKISRFVKTTSSNNKYSGKNVRLGDGRVGYVTERGFFKEYPSKSIMSATAGENGCPPLNDITNIPFVSNGNVIPTDPELIVGTPMKEKQPCGNEGDNVQVTSANSDTSASWVGCYATVDGSGLEYQSDMGNYANLQSCKTRAQDLGYTVISLSNGGDGTSKCYIGNDVNKATSGGVASKRMVSYELLKGEGTTSGILMNGQLGLGTGSPNTWNVRKFDADTTCDETKGAFLNTNDTTASYGSNCDGKTKHFSFLNNLFHA